MCSISGSIITSGTPEHVRNHSAVLGRIWGGHMSTQNPPILELQDVRAGYGGITTVHGVSLSVRAGEGRRPARSNGASKSTTQKVASGYTRPPRAGCATRART